MSNRHKHHNEYAKCNGENKDKKDKGNNCYRNANGTFDRAMTEVKESDDPHKAVPNLIEVIAESIDKCRKEWDRIQNEPVFSGKDVARIIESSETRMMAQVRRKSRASFWCGIAVGAVSALVASSIAVIWTMKFAA